MNVKQVIVMRKKFPIEENGQIVMRNFALEKWWHKVLMLLWL